MNKKKARVSSAVLVFVFVTTIVAYSFVNRVQAAALTSSKVTITDSRSGGTSVGHTLDFTTATTGTIATILIEYVTTPTGSSVPTGLVTTSASMGALSGLSASTANVTSNGTIIVTVTTPASINSGTPITIPFTGITNPTADNTTSFVRITTRASGPTTIDTTTVAFAVLTSTSVAMTATVDSSFSFSLAAVSSGGSVNAATTNVTTTASTIPFGTLAAGAPKIAAIDTTVTTNSLLGYKITIASPTGAGAPLESGSNNIDSFTGTNATPTTWSSPAGSSANVNTGFMGYTTEDSGLSTSSTRFTSGAPKWAGLTTTPGELVYLATATTGRTIRIGFEAEVNALQPFGSYTGTVLLVATPTY